MSGKKVAGAFLLFVGALGMSAILVELVLRVYAPLAETSLAQALRVDPYAVLVEPHGEAGYRPRPGRIVPYANGTAAHINDMGFRGPTVPVPKPADTYRVVLLGGSTTFGWGVDDDDTIARYLEQELAGRVSGRTFEVVSLAFDGYDSYQLFERFRSDGPRLEPDAVIVNTGINDVRNAWYTDIADGDRRTLLYLATLDQLRLEEERGGPTMWTRAKHWSYVMRVPGWVRQQLYASAGEAMASAQTATYHWDALDYFERNIERLIDLGAQADADVLLSTAPSSLRTMFQPTDPPWTSYWIVDAQTTQLYRDSLSARLQNVAARAAAAGKPVTYVTGKELPVDLFIDDAHLTPDGNRRMAEILAGALAPLISGEAKPSGE